MRAFVSTIGCALLSYVGVSAHAASPSAHSHEDEQQLGEMHIPCVQSNETRWLPGIDYSLLFSGLASEAARAGDQIELLEFTHYRGPEALTTRSDFLAWLREERGRIKLTHIPWILLPHTRVEARMYYVLENLGRTDLHKKFRDWITDIHVPPRFWAYGNEQYPSEQTLFRYNVEFAIANGIEEPAFTETYSLTSITESVEKAEALSRAFTGENGTPTYVVNRRYSASVGRILSNSHGSPNGDPSKELFELVKFLATAELEHKYLTLAELRKGGFARLDCSNHGF